MAWSTIKKNLFFGNDLINGKKVLYLEIYVSWWRNFFSRCMGRQK